MMNQSILRVSAIRERNFLSVLSHTTVSTAGRMERKQRWEWMDAQTYKIQISDIRTSRRDYHGNLRQHYTLHSRFKTDHLKLYCAKKALHYPYPEGMVTSLDSEVSGVDSCCDHMIQFSRCFCVVVQTAPVSLAKLCSTSVMSPFMQKFRRPLIFQRDNETPHSDTKSH